MGPRWANYVELIWVSSGQPIKDQYGFYMDFYFGRPYLMNMVLLEFHLGSQQRVNMCTLWVPSMLYAENISMLIIMMALR